MTPLRINTGASIRRQEIAGGHDCVIVDDFLRDPHELVEFAASHAGEFSRPNRGYPGRQFGIDDNAMAEIYRFIGSGMTKHYPFFRGDSNLWAFLSMVTMQPGELPNQQRICHVDPNPHPDRTVYAGLVYLFENEDLGGTGFYRWKERDLVGDAIAIESQDSGKGLEFLQQHFPTIREPACYMTESNEIAELVCTIPARFNRMIFYSGEVPHSGAITAPELLSRDIRKGRLTLNFFANVVPK